jgi:hypothetical protein
VIPRIVRRAPFAGDRMIHAVGLAVRAARSAGKTTLGSMILVGVLLAALGASAGIALRSLAGAPQAVPAPSPVVVPAVAAAALPPTAAQDAPPAGADVPTEENSLPTEPAARVAMTARATPAGPRVRGPQRSDRRITHGRIHPTLARPGARRVVTGKPKLR